MNVPRITVIIGSLLIIIGVGGYYLTGAASMTALIPAFLGLLLGLFGYLALIKPASKKHFMHGAAMIGLLGIFGTITAIPDFFTVLGGGEVANAGAVIARTLTAVLCIIFMIIAVKSFIDARKEREEAA